jgi:hypothetical protein
MRKSLIPALRSAEVMLRNSEISSATANTSQVSHCVERRVILRVAAKTLDIRVWTGIGLGQDRSKLQMLVITLLKLRNP